MSESTDGVTAVVAYVPDLMDRSKVSAAFGERVHFARTVDDLVRHAPAAALVIVDLSRPGASDALTGIGEGPRVVGFGPHVDGAALAAAAEAGHEALARSAFFRRLGELAESV